MARSVLKTFAVIAVGAHGVMEAHSDAHTGDDGPREILLEMHPYPGCEGAPVSFGRTTSYGNKIDFSECTSTYEEYQSAAHTTGDDHGYWSSSKFVCVPGGGVIAMSYDALDIACIGEGSPTMILSASSYDGFRTGLCTEVQTDDGPQYWKVTKGFEAWPKCGPDDYEGPKFGGMSLNYFNDVGCPGAPNWAVAVAGVDIDFSQCTTINEDNDHGKETFYAQYTCGEDAGSMVEHVCSDSWCTECKETTFSATQLAILSQGQCAAVDMPFNDNHDMQTVGMTATIDGHVTFPDCGMRLFSIHPFFRGKVASKMPVMAAAAGAVIAGVFLFAVGARIVKNRNQRKAAYTGVIDQEQVTEEISELGQAPLVE